MILSLSLSLSLLPMPMPMPMLLLLLLVQVLMLVLVLVLVLVPGWAGPSRVGVATAAALAAATIRSPPRHPRGESVLYYKS
ncbi:hypothetical protein [Burkholderia pseudomallei]|uniref:hypothetical protein n=1 Tax=Burkholderia pseudomallei TaxID=28450 RepID=UPI002115DBC7|nr:hypothetical protein [Burkholderia pseudomallei]